MKKKSVSAPRDPSLDTLLAQDGVDRTFMVRKWNNKGKEKKRKENIFIVDRSPKRPIIAMWPTHCEYNA